jgi:hypothetical protein
MQVRLAVITPIALSLMASACSNDAVAPHSTILELPPVLLVAINNPAANGQFAGTVIGHPIAGDSAPVANAVVDVYMLQTGAQDTLRNEQPDSLGTITTASNGTFQLADIPAGLYALKVIPPASSGFRETDLWYFVSDGRASQNGDIGAYPR